MNILIIATYFVPDSAIAAVRPYMLAGHLAENGHQVTVLRAGIFQRLPFDEYDESNEPFEVITALGSDCDAEKFRRGEYKPSPKMEKVKYPFIPLFARVALRFVRDGVRKVIQHKPPRFLEEPMRILEAQKQTLLNMQGRTFDVVFSTFGNMENIEAGIFAADHFHARLIMDYRDSPVDRTEWMDIVRNAEAVKMTKRVLERADCVTAVSDALAEEIRGYRPGTRVVTVHNGFDDTLPLPDASPEEGVLSVCYTGTLYLDSMPALRMLVQCIAGMISRGELERKRIRFHYAGSHAEEFRAVFEKNGIADILTDHGYLSRQETLRLQTASDLFLVLSWNRRNSQGILTGKFYEGIQTGKPILVCVSGNLAGSELMQLQQQYQYGFCLEQASAKKQLPALEAYISQLCQEKLANGRLSYQPSEALRSAFGYTGIARQVRQIMEELVTKR